MEIRLATIYDAEAIRNVYGYYVVNSAMTFEYGIPTLEDMRNRISTTRNEGYPYYVMEEDKKIIGFSYAGPLRRREAYAHSAEITIYIVEEYTRSGIGHKLYEKVEAFLKKRGITNVYACVAYADENDEYLTDRSKRFHESMGYKEVGRFHKCGKKFDRYYDILWMEKSVL